MCNLFYTFISIYINDLSFKKCLIHWFLKGNIISNHFNVNGLYAPMKEIVRMGEKTILN